MAALDIVFLLDKSYSMSAKTPDGKSRALHLAACMADIATHIRKCKVKVSLCIYQFNSGLELLLPATNKEQLGDKRVQELGERFTCVEGGTALYDSAIEVLAKMRRYKTAEKTKRCLVMLTDGEDVHSKKQASDFVAALRKPGIQINFINVFGRRPDYADEIEKIRHVHVSSSEDYSGFIRALQKLKEYVQKTTKELEMMETVTVERQIRDPKTGKVSVIKDTVIREVKGTEDQLARLQLGWAGQAAIAGGAGGGGARPALPAPGGGGAGKLKKLCRSIQNGAKCTYGDKCHFAHKACRFGQQCNRGSACTFGH
ncbi:unnamed protein product [Pedinophyceae sp. YPF-701]|nr:unnamed protein product [Pedinophyceae sp. YPF-701]